MMGENDGVRDRSEKCGRRNRVNVDNFRHVEFEVMVGTQSREVLEV